MIDALRTTWPLLFGVGLLMIGNGLQGSLLGVRGEIEGFSTGTMSLVMSAYFAGFLVSSLTTPKLIRRVGHIRVFAALGSLISAVLILYPTVAEPWAWVALRALIGFCFCGVYVTAESWLNNMSTAENRGRSLSLYMIVQMAGIVSAQGILAFGDPSGFVLFIVPSVLVSLSFAPILLTAERSPSFENTKPMDLRGLFAASPLGVVGMFLMGGIFASQFGMSAVYATQAGLSVQQLAGFVAAIYTGGLIMQYPIGWLSDRTDRRNLIFLVALCGVGSAVIGLSYGEIYPALLAAGFLFGGLSNPLYALLIAHVNDYLDAEDMAAAAGGLLFVNGVGAVLGPLALGWLLGTIGPPGFWIFPMLLFALLSLYTLWRMSQRPARATDETVSYQAVFPTASPAAFEGAADFYDDPGDDPGAAISADREDGGNPRAA